MNQHVFALRAALKRQDEEKHQTNHAKMETLRSNKDKIPPMHQLLVYRNHIKTILTSQIMRELS